MYMVTPGGPRYFTSRKISVTIVLRVSVINVLAITRRLVNGCQSCKSDPKFVENLFS